MTRVTINRDLFLWAIDRSGINIEAFETRFPKIHDWMDGVMLPTIKQVEDFARAVHAPFGYMFLPTPPEERLPIPYFRTIASLSLHKPSAELLDTAHTMQTRQAYMRDMVMEGGISPLGFVGSAKNASDPTTVATEIRDTLGLTEGWASSYPTWTEALHALEDIIEQAGILVMANGVVGNNTRRRLDPQEFRGFVLIDEFAPLVFINRADAKAAQMFTLAHEIAHVWVGQSAAFDLRGMEPSADAIEQTCNRIAAELLVPATELQNNWAGFLRDAEPFQAIARRFKVSVLVAARRAKDLGLITTNEYFTFYDAYLVDDRRKRENTSDGGNFYATQTRRVGRRFAESVIRATREGTLLFHEAYKLTNLRGKTFDQFASRILGEIAA